jgi:hypothetical protein
MQGQKLCVDAQGPLRAADQMIAKLSRLAPPVQYISLVIGGECGDEEAESEVLAARDADEFRLHAATDCLEA